MLVILGVFLMIAVVLFAERSGIQYTEKNRKVAYLSQEEVVTEQMAAKSLMNTLFSEVSGQKVHFHPLTPNHTVP